MNLNEFEYSDTLSYSLNMLDCFEHFLNIPDQGIILNDPER